MLQPSSTFSRSSFSMVNRWLQVMSFSCACVYVKNRVRKRKHHSSFTKSKLLQLHLTPPPETDVPAWGLAYLHPSNPVLIYQIGPKTWADPQFNSGQANPAHWIHYEAPSKICNLVISWHVPKRINAILLIMQLCSTRLGSLYLTHRCNTVWNSMLSPLAISASVR